MLFPWYTFCLLFLLPFFDPRRPFRLLHVDLVALLAIGIWPLGASLGTEPPAWTAAITVAGLIWLLGRLLRSGLRPQRRPEQLVPVLPASWLAIAVVLLVCLRLGSLVLAPAYVSDVGVASVIGADLIGDGESPYSGGVLHREPPHGDTYGPVTYLAYVPFEQALPWRGRLTIDLYTPPKAARLSAVLFDSMTLLFLFMLGRRLRPGPEGRLLGVSLAWAWVAYPYSLLVLRFSFSDTLVGMLALAAVLALQSPAGRGALAALAGATKFAPLVLVPLLATGTGERRLRSSLLFAAAFTAVTAAVFLPLMPDGGLSELYDRTLGYQEVRRGWVRIWASFPELDWLQTIVQLIVAGAAVLLAFVPRRKTFFQVVALAGALSIAVQLAAWNWSAAYAVWFAPLAFAGLFAVYDCRDQAGGRSRRALRARKQAAAT
jgi:hypothetical protein